MPGAGPVANRCEVGSGARPTGWGPRWSGRPGNQRYAHGPSRVLTGSQADAVRGRRQGVGGLPRPAGDARLFALRAGRCGEPGRPRKGRRRDPLQRGGVPPCQCLGSCAGPPGVAGRSCCGCRGVAGSAREVPADPGPRAAVAVRASVRRGAMRGTGPGGREPTPRRRSVPHGRQGRGQRRLGPPGGRQSPSR